MITTILFVILALLVTACGVESINIDLPTSGIGFLLEPAGQPFTHTDTQCPVDVEAWLDNFDSVESPFTPGQNVVVTPAEGWHCFYLHPDVAADSGLLPWAWQVFVPMNTIAAPEGAVISARPAATP